MTDKSEYQFRIDFYKAKMAAYRKRRPGRLPARTTFRQWAHECDEALAARQVPTKDAAPQPDGGMIPPGVIQCAGRYDMKIYQPTFYTQPEAALPGGKGICRASIGLVSLWTTEDMLYGVVYTTNGYRIATARELEKALNALRQLVEDAAPQPGGDPQS